MLVYVLSKNGQPLMPTHRCGFVRRLLNSQKAKVVRRCPFTIQLQYDTDCKTQPVTLGIDAGSEHIGVSATTESKVLYEADIELRNDIVDLLATRRQMRRARRSRKTRYRKARFDNRKRNDKWLAPSIQHKVNCHLEAVRFVHKLLPISKIIVEVASFDIQKIKNPLITSTDYQNGELLDWKNVREYVLFRDSHICQCCKGKSKDPVLQVHHIESRKTGGNAPNNLITLCKTCHNGYHHGTVKLPAKIKRGMKFNDATFMGIMRWGFYNQLKSLYPDVSLTYGYITKDIRISNGLAKTHFIDARCISGNPLATSDNTVYFLKKRRRHNRQIHKFNILKGGRKKRNQAAYLVKGYRLFDKVNYNRKEYFIFGRRASGFFDIRTLSGEKVNKGSISCKKLKLLEASKGYLTERRNAFLSPLNSV